MNNQYDLESIANVIRDSKTDIIGLQEVDVRWGTRSNFKNESQNTSPKIRKTPIKRIIRIYERHITNLHGNF